MKKIAIPLILGIVAVMLYFLPGAGNALEMNRTLLRQGEIWRLFTCQWVHCSFDHMYWDVAAFIAAGLIVSHKDFKIFCLTTAITTAAIPLAVLWQHPGMEFYRGLSGIDTALYCITALLLFREAIRDRSMIRVIFNGVIIVAIISKSVYEFFTGSIIFCNSNAFIPVPTAHLTGIIIGIIIFALINIPSSGACRQLDAKESGLAIY